MDEYIELEDAIKLIFEQFHMYFEVPCLPRDEAIQRQVCAVRDKINQLPAADVASVRHGHWIIPTKISGRDFDIPHCSACDGVHCGVDKNTNFCPNCGAKIEEVFEWQT